MGGVFETLLWLLRNEVLQFQWILSPLGGQGSLRLINEMKSTRFKTTPVYYSDPSAGINLIEAEFWFALVPTVLGASLSMSADVKNRL